MATSYQHSYSPMNMRLASGTLAIILLGVTVFATYNQGDAQSVTPTVEACNARIVKELTMREIEFRRAVFGEQIINDTIYSNTLGSAGNAQGAKAKPGIFATKGRLTSELVPALVESYRRLGCELRNVCDRMQKSFRTPTITVPFDVDLLGCEPEKNKVAFAECAFGLAGNESSSTGFASSVSMEGIGNEGAEGTMTQQCSTYVQSTLAFEAEVLKLATAYDKEYRSTLQWAGMVDHFAEQSAKQHLPAIQNMVSLLGTLHTIPCFLGQCDMPAFAPNFTSGPQSSSSSSNP